MRLRALYTVTVFSGAALLFLVQPVAAKRLLPVLGGSPSVWIACMLFFQAALLAGYGYAHLFATRVPARAQAALHALVVVLPLAFLPVRLPGLADAPVVESPLWWLLGALALGVGAPFLVLATTGPLLQRWFSRTGDPAAGDPYFLYAAGNLGSLGALLAFPLVLEPALRLYDPNDALLPSGLSSPTINLLWALGYVVYAGLVVACGFAARRPGAGPARPQPVDAPKHRPISAGPRGRWQARALWTGLAFVPSSLTLGTTLWLTTDVAAVPLLWVLPLALYLLSFVVAYSRRWSPPARPVGVAFALLAVVTAVVRWMMLRPPPLLMIPLGLATLFAGALLCHVRLSESRPAPARLTEYYLWIAFGGALGGLFNALAAPLLFRDVLEFPLALVLAALARPQPSSPARVRRGRPAAFDVALPAALALLIWAVHLAATTGDGTPAWLMRQVPIAAGAAALLLRGRPVRFALALAVVLGAGSLLGGAPGETLYAERTFFGVLRIKRNAGVPFMLTEGPGAGQPRRIDSFSLFHGSTRHGRQLVDREFRRTATAYFHPSGPIGNVFATLRDGSTLDEVGVVGLGVGTLAAYVQPGQRMTFYEVDPAVARIARDGAYFTFLAEAGGLVEVRIGDGRLLLSREPDARFGLLIVDGFSSDAIPVHLMTREAFETYARVLRPRGLLALHVTSEHFDLVPVARALAADLRMQGIVWNDRKVTPEQIVEGKSRSIWVVLAREPAALAPLRADSRWGDLRTETAERRFLWTDDWSSLWSVLD